MLVNAEMGVKKMVWVYIVVPQLITQVLIKFLIKNIWVLWGARSMGFKPMKNQWFFVIPKKGHVHAKIVFKICE